MELRGPASFPSVSGVTWRTLFAIQHLAWRRLRGDRHALVARSLTQCPAESFLSTTLLLAPCSRCGGLQLPQLNLVLV